MFLKFIKNNKLIHLCIKKITIICIIDFLSHLQINELFKNENTIICKNIVIVNKN